MYTHICTCVYIYIYVYRERERERDIVHKAIVIGQITTFQYFTGLLTVIGIVTYDYCNTVVGLL